MIAFIMRLIGFLTLKPWRERREAVKRRANYDAIKARIVEEHLDGKGGLVLAKKYDLKDQACFSPPMYALAKNQYGQLLIFWDRKKMTEEVGPPRAERKEQNVESVQSPTPSDGYGDIAVV